MPPSDLANSLRRRQLAREKMKRYWHTGSFDRLAGHYGVQPRRVRQERPEMWRAGLVLTALLLLGIGLRYALFF